MLPGKSETIPAQTMDQVTPDRMILSQDIKQLFDQSFQLWFLCYICTKKAIVQAVKCTHPCSGLMIWTYTMAWLQNQHLNMVEVVKLLLPAINIQERQRERRQMFKSIFVPFLGEPCGEVGGEDSCEEAFEIVSSACFLWRSKLPSSESERIFFKACGEFMPLIKGGKKACCKQTAHVPFPLYGICV